MIKFSRISAIIYRHLVPTFRDPIRLTDMAYYPLVDLILFGFLGVWAHGSQTGSDNFVFALLTSIACWYLVYRSTLEISRNLLIEIWDSSLVNLLATPLTTTEFMISLMTLGFIQAFITFIYSSLLILLIFSKNIFSVYPLIAPYLPLFIVCGWIIGILTSALIFYFGKSIEFITWAIPCLFAILSGSFCSIDLFPHWVQKIASLFPLKYLFILVRQAIDQKSVNIFSHNFFIATLLTVFYFILVSLFLTYMVNKAKNKGLNNLG